MATLDPDAEARRALRRHKLFATALLVLMAGLIGLCYALPHDTASAWLLASSKAGFIGGIADWFAVTALFRHPLGIPIPHTAIIPHEKERLGRALGGFVARHVITGAEVSRVLRELDLPGIVHRFLADPALARPAVVTLAGMLPGALASFEDGRARRLFARLVPRLAGSKAAGVVVARALRGLVEGGRHQEVFGFVLNQVREIIAAKQDQLRSAIEERVREQGGRLVGWAIGASVARRVLASIEAELDRMNPDGSDLRAAFDEWARNEIARMEEDPARAAEIGAAIRRTLSHPSLVAWMMDLWTRLREAFEADAARPEGHTVVLLENAFASLGALLEADPAARLRLESAIEGLIRSLLPGAQTRIAEFIAEVVGGWDTATITERLELRVGKDLQFVRVNGTLVGFLVGGVLYAVLDVAFR